MDVLAILLALIGLHAVFVLAEYAFSKTAHSDLAVNQNTSPSAMTAAICRQMEDYLTVCTLARTIIVMSIGVLFGFIVNDMNELTNLSWDQWALFALAFSSILLVHMVVGFELPKVFAISRTRDCTEALAWHLVISRVVLWPLLWLVNQLKRYTYCFA